MRPLVKLADLEPRQYDEVMALLRKHGVHYKEIPSGMFDVGFIMVADHDFKKAKAILREESREFAHEARQAWEQAWRTEYGGSWLKWFVHQVWKNPGGTLVRVFLLVLMVAIFVVYPVWYVLRSFWFS